MREALKILDPGGVEARSRHCLKRRKYTNKGPNYIWHIDGYDKLKPFGFCIHGAIDGYTRRILWLEVGPSNNNPAIIASYYLKFVLKHGVTARVIRTDMGTENVSIAAIQRFFRRSDDDGFAAEKSFLYGKSTTNQRIEAWWSIYLRSLGFCRGSSVEGRKSSVEGQMSRVESKKSRVESKKSRVARKSRGSQEKVEGRKKKSRFVF